MDPNQFLRGLLDAAISAARPELCLPPHLPAPPKGRTIVVGAGKAAAAMACVVEDYWEGPLSGLVVTRYGHALPCIDIEVVEASHPVPDAAGQVAAQQMLDLVSDLTKDDLVLCLLSGGGSALLSLPGEDVTLEDKQRITQTLLKSGAPIKEINCVRKHLSAIKGGRLAQAAFPAKVVTLAISDVVGDDPSVIASGPTVADPTTIEQAQDILTRYNIPCPALSETPKDVKADFTVIASAKQALEAASAFAEHHGIRPILLGDDIEGEARGVAKAHAALALTTDGPSVLLSGGELTVTVKGEGKGGPNTEYALALALELTMGPNKTPSIYALACDTDGTDGTGDNAGALIGPGTELAGAAEALAKNDAYGFFQTAGGLVKTGPTLTNVNDFRAILVL